MTNEYLDRVAAEAAHTIRARHVFMAFEGTRYAATLRRQDAARVARAAFPNDLGNYDPAEAQARRERRAKQEAVRPPTSREMFAALAAAFVAFRGRPAA